MTETKEIEFWIAIDADGEFCVDTDCAEDAANGIGGITRVFAFKVTLPLPKPTEVAVAVPDTDQPVNVTVS